jgi:CO/xanthine dehydrogenase Mo-binding subunit
MLYGNTEKPYAHAKIVNIDTSKAEKIRASRLW